MTDRPVIGPKPEVLVPVYPTPWHIDPDWSTEVISADGEKVGDFASPDLAKAVVELVNEKFGTPDFRTGDVVTITAMPPEDDGVCDHLIGDQVTIVRAHPNGWNDYYHGPVYEVKDEAGNGWFAQKVEKV